MFGLAPSNQFCLVESVAAYRLIQENGDVSLQYICQKYLHPTVLSKVESCIKSNFNYLSSDMMNSCTELESDR